MHTVQGWLHMRASAATMRDKHPLRAANTMLTAEQTTDLMMIVNDDSESSPQFGVDTEAIPWPTVTDGSAQRGQGAAMLMIIDDP